TTAAASWPPATTSSASSPTGWTSPSAPRSATSCARSPSKSTPGPDPRRKSGIPPGGSTTSRDTFRIVRKASDTGPGRASGGAVVGIGSRKRRTGRDEPLGFPSAEDALREAIIGRLFDGVLRSARSQLLRAGSPLAVEIWGSGLLAVWDGLPGPSAIGPGGDDSPAGAFTEALIRRAQELATPDAMAVLAAVAAVAPSRVATRGRTAAATLEQAGIPAPEWTAVAGTAVPTEAWIGTDVYGDQEIVIVGFAYPGLAGDRGHSICVLVDHTERGVARDAYPAGPLDQTLARWREAEAAGISLRPATLPEVAARLADA